MTSDDRISICTNLIAPLFDALARQALESGWSEEEVALALAELADARVARVLGNAMSEAEIEMQTIRASAGKSR